MRWRLGTMGFSYPAWGGKGGAFYPPGTKQGEYLSYYARCFDAVEMDTTFYACPDRARVRRWAEATGPDFRFAFKTPRDITHADDVGAMGTAMGAFVGAVTEAGEKLGVVLLQFPPSFGASRWQELDALLQTVPADVPLAAEFRHGSWWGQDGIREMLEHYKVAWTSADYIGPEGRPVGSARELRVTGERAYVRLIGQHDRYPDMNREVLDVSADLAWWKEQIERSGIEEAWVLFNNDYAGFSIATAERFKRMLGLEVCRPVTLKEGLFG